VETKARILDAAQQLFAAKGYAQAQLREIAALAGVAVSLIPQHFGSKSGLFELALIEAMKANRVLDAPTSDLGRALIDYVLDDGDIRLPAMVILSIGDPVSQEITTRVLRDQIVMQLAARLGPPDARDRAVEITMLATGFLIYTRQLPIGHVAERTRRKFATILQAIIDET
jgi:AcrR family transcriptional regulator